MDDETTDAVGLAALVRRGEVSPEALTEAAIARIEDENPALNALVHPMYGRARARIAAGLPDGPLRGVPILLKDLHATVAGHPTSASTRLLEHLPASDDATLVRRLEAAGLVILGKTNTPEHGIMGITEPDLHGPTRNPWNPDHTPGGSSGGSAAAVAAGWVPVAHASDGGGSIRIPASHCGLVGLKPTRGRTPTGPEHGEGWGGLVAEHAVTRTVRDTAALLDATRGPEPGAPYQVRPPDRPYVDEVGADPGRLRIAVSTQALLAGESDPAVVAAVEDAARLAEDLGHEVLHTGPLLNPDALRHAYFVHVAAGVAEDVDAAAARAGVDPRASDVEPTTWLFRRIGRALSAADLESARRTAQTLGFHLAAFFEGVDVWLTPTCACPPARIGALYPDRRKEQLMQVLRRVGTRGVLLKALDRLAADALSATPNTQVANLAGIPAISLPTWWTDDGLPVGTQWMAPFGQEDVLFRLAAQIEVARPWAGRRPPSRGHAS